MVMVSKFSNFPDELSENDELREFELSGSDCTWKSQRFKIVPILATHCLMKQDRMMTTQTVTLKLLQNHQKYQKKKKNEKKQPNFNHF